MRWRSGWTCVLPGTGYSYPLDREHAFHTACVCVLAIATSIRPCSGSHTFGLWWAWAMGSLLHNDVRAIAVLGTVSFIRSSPLPRSRLQRQRPPLALVRRYTLLTEQISLIRCIPYRISITGPAIADDVSGSVRPVAQSRCLRCTPTCNM